MQRNGAPAYFDVSLWKFGTEAFRNMRNGSGLAGLPEIVKWPL
jgi:hypothetical protein